VARATWTLAFLPAWLWAAAALWIDGPAPPAVAGGLAAAFLAASLASLWIPASRPRGAATCTALLAVVVIWWLRIEPSNDRDWQPDVARTPTVERDGDLVTLHNVRNFAYRTETDFDEVWETRTYDLSQLSGADISFTHWGSPWIAHTIVSWEFAQGPPLAISIETRKERGEAYSSVLGFFRQYELYYVVADERDLLRLRTNYRKGEEVYLYHLTTPLPRLRAILLDYLRVIDALAEEPRWYNAFTHNCTTSIRHHVQHVAPGQRFDWRFLVNGLLPELLYDQGRFVDSLPFEELKRRAWINERARAADDDAAFSARIRVGLPGHVPAP
jgi:hypothetical protein